MRCETIITRLAEQAANGQAGVSGVEFARFMARIAKRPSTGLALASYLVSTVIEDSNTCLVLNEDFLKAYAMEKGVEWLWQEIGGFREFMQDIEASGVVGRPGDTSPFILAGQRLYLHRYLAYEDLVARDIKARGKVEMEVPDSAIEFANKLFPPGPARPDWQKLAALNAVARRFSVVSGGPGTGKTRTVAAMMAIIQHCYSPGSLSMALCAPTGKAAARLTESIHSALGSLKKLGLPDETANALPVEAMTVHRLLGTGFRPGFFRFNRENPLPWDVVIVDEASMLDLPMMAHLCEALSRDARLIFIGDHCQLASVEAGSVLADICFGRDKFAYSSRFRQMAERAGEFLGNDSDCPEIQGPEKPRHFLRDCIITLEHNFRFEAGSGIHELANAVNKGSVSDVLELLSKGDVNGVRFVNDREAGLAEFLEKELEIFISSILENDDIYHAIASLDNLRILCAVKDGPHGSRNVNDFAAWRFFRQPARTNRLFKGLPVIIRRNDYNLGLFNGDTGMVWKDRHGRLKVCFQSNDSVRSFSPSMLPRFDPAWAVTVHVSQGSEFDRVLLVLPPASSLMAGRELLYTAITRARKEIVIWGSVSALEHCIKQHTARESGLKDLLWD